MEIFTLLETLEDIISSGKGIPFSNRTVVDKDEILDIIKEIRSKLPDELKQAKWVKEERQRILAEAQKEADDMQKEAENKIVSLIDEHEITKQAYKQKAEIIGSANETSREIVSSAYEAGKSEAIKNKLGKMGSFKEGQDGDGNGDEKGSYGKQLAQSTKTQQPEVKNFFERK